MKFLKLTLVAAISLGAFTGIAQVSAATTEGLNGRSKVYSPDVDQVKRADVAGFVIAARGQLTATNEAGEVRELDRRSKFYANETLKTGVGSMAQLRFKDRALMTLKAESQLDIGEYHFGGAKDPENKSFLSLVSGGFRTISGAIGSLNESAYRIETPAASIGIRGTDYELVISLDGKVFAAVHDGGISIVNDIGELDLGADSEYLFAEVGEGQPPLGLTQMPEIFQVSAGQKKELTPEQKEKVAKKLEKGKEKAAALLANLGGGKPDRDDGAIQKSVFERLVRNDTSIDTRIDPSLLLELKRNGRYALLTSEEDVGDFVVGKTLDKNGNKLFYGENGELLRFSPQAIMHDGQAVESGLANVDWGRWNKALSLQADGSESVFEKNVYWMDAKIYDQVAISQKTGLVDVGLIGFSAGTSYENLFKINDQTAWGSALLNFDTKMIEGSITMGLLDISSLEQGTAVGDLTINFNGGMSSNNFNPDASFQVTNEALGLPLQAPIPMSTGTQVKGTLVAPATVGGDPGLAGAFSAQLPSEVTKGISVGVQGLFTMGSTMPGKAAPAPFL